MRRLLKLLGRMGKVDEVAPDHFFLRDTVAEMVEIAADVAAQARQGEFIAAQFRDRLDNGRKVAIQILEFFDRHGVTLRRGDLRRMNPQRLDLFRPAGREPATGFWKRSVPGGASGLQIREGPRAGPWWVRLPLSSATFQQRRTMTPPHPCAPTSCSWAAGTRMCTCSPPSRCCPSRACGITLITRDLETPYSGMLPGVVGGLYTAEEAHIDLVRLAAATGTRADPRRSERHRSR